MTRSPIVGDHVWAQRIAYTHHGIWLGDDEIAHYTGEPGDIKNATIAVTSLAEFLKKSKTVYILDYPSFYTPEAIVERALSRVGEKKYSLLANNCEMFATWCRLGKGFSRQAEAAGEIAHTIGAIAVRALVKALR